MSDTKLDQPIPEVIFRTTSPLRRWAESFIRSKISDNLAPKSILAYRAVLATFCDWCELRGITTIEALDPATLREYLIHLADKGHNPGGVAHHYRPVRTMLKWYEAEDEPVGWRNPINRVKEPKSGDPYVPVVSSEIVMKLIASANAGPNPVRDVTILLVLFDTGLRASELVALNVEDVDEVNGTAVILRGKGRKARVVPFGERTRKMVRRLVRTRPEDGPLLATAAGDRLTYWGLRQVVRRAADRAGVKAPSLHSFRRGSTTEMIRNRADKNTVKRIMGWDTDEMYRRYDRRSAADIAAAHRETSPVDRAGIS